MKWLGRRVSLGDVAALTLVPWVIFAASMAWAADGENDAVSNVTLYVVSVVAALVGAILGYIAYQVGSMREQLGQALVSQAETKRDVEHLDKRVEKLETQAA